MRARDRAGISPQAMIVGVAIGILAWGLDLTGSLPVSRPTAAILTVIIAALAAALVDSKLSGKW